MPFIAQKGPWTLRSVTREDCETLAGLVWELADYEHRTDEVHTTAATLSEALFERRIIEAMLLEVSGQAVGYCLFYTRYSSYSTRSRLYLEDLFIRTELRGGGIGRWIMAQLARLCRERGYIGMEWSVLTWNQPSIAFYERLGAERENTHFSYMLSGGAYTALADSADK